MKRIYFNLRWEYILAFTSIVAVIVLAILLIIQGFVYGYKQITIFKEQLEASRIINQQYKVIFDMQDVLNLKLISMNEMKARKKLYDDAEQKLQRESLTKVETEISKKICPVGTYVYLKDLCMPVRVKAINGFEAETYEGRYFLTVDTDNWYTLSYHEYNLLKSKGKKNTGD